MNDNNILNLRVGSFGRVLDLKEGKTVFLPTLRKIANARVLEVSDDGSLRVHWKSNFNLDGHFKTEVMSFTNELVLDEGDKDERNQIRVKNDLMPIK